MTSARSGLRKQMGLHVIRVALAGLAIALAGPASAQRAKLPVFRIDDAIYGLAGPQDASRSCLSYGARVGAFRVARGDRAFFDKDRGVDRCELVALDRAVYGKDYRLSYEFMVSRSSKLAKWTVLGQWHQTPDSGENVGVSPPFALVLNNEGDLVILMRTTGEKFQNYNSKERLLFQDRKFRLRRWYRMDYSFNWNPIGRGHIKGWRDGVKIFEYTGPTGYNDDVGPYWQFGIYREEAADETQVYYRNVRLMGRWQ